MYSNTNVYMLHTSDSKHAVCYIVHLLNTYCVGVRTSLKNLFVQLSNIQGVIRLTFQIQIRPIYSTFL